jgi:hypothetical protein
MSLHGPAGSAASLGNFFTGMFSAARNLLNYTTYYQMKERWSGRAYRREPGDWQDPCSAPNLRVHLIGHSFGGDS